MSKHKARTPHKDFDVFGFIGELKHEKKKHLKDIKICLKCNMYSAAARSNETVNTLEFVIQKLEKYVREGNE